MWGLLWASSCFHYLLLVCKCILTSNSLAWQDSVYFHPTLNPTGAPPPGKPPMYRSSIGKALVEKVVSVMFWNPHMLGGCETPLAFVSTNNEVVFVL